jgi:hypothetical protein
VEVSKIECKKTATKASEMLIPKSGDYSQAPPLEALQGKGSFGLPGNSPVHIRPSSVKFYVTSAKKV